jgi:hypothetical protein
VLLDMNKLLAPGSLQVNDRAAEAKAAAKTAAKAATAR